MNMRFVAAGILLLGALLVFNPAMAELKVTLTIDGDLEELLQVLQHLKQMGVGADAVQGTDAFRLHMHSTHNAPPMSGDTESVDALRRVGAETGAVAQQAEEEKPEPPTALRNLALEPESAAPGESVLVTVQVVDQNNAIDTVALTLKTTNLTADLYDNGTNGDAFAGDGIWSTKVYLPPELQEGLYVVELLAYDANGAPIMVLTEDRRVTTLSAKIPLALRRE